MSVSDYLLRNPRRSHGKKPDKYKLTKRTVERLFTGVVPKSDRNLLYTRLSRLMKARGIDYDAAHKFLNELVQRYDAVDRLIGFIEGDILQFNSVVIQSNAAQAITAYANYTPMNIRRNPLIERETDGEVDEEEPSDEDSGEHVTGQPRVEGDL